MLPRTLVLIGSILFFTNGFAACIGVGCQCTASASVINFGTYNPVGGVVLDTTGNVQVVCSVLLLGLTVSYTIGFNTGNGGSYTPRQMSRMSYRLNYNLYTDAARSQIWGDGTGGTSLVSDNYNLALLSQTRNYSVYGRIPASQIVAAGGYSDTILVTVTF